MWKGEAKFEEPLKSTEITKDLEGTWEGSLQVQGTVLRLIVKLTNNAGGATGMLVSVESGQAPRSQSRPSRRPCRTWPSSITLVNASYAGDLKDGQIVGTWTQGPASMPLVFKRPAK